MKDADRWPGISVVLILLAIITFLAAGLGLVEVASEHDTSGFTVFGVGSLSGTMFIAAAMVIRLLAQIEAHVRPQEKTISPEEERFEKRWTTR